MKSWFLWFNIIPIKGWGYLDYSSVLRFLSTLLPVLGEIWHAVRISHLNWIEHKLYQVVFSRSVTRWYHKMIYCSTLCIYLKKKNLIIKSLNWEHQQNVGRGSILGGVEQLSATLKIGSLLLSNSAGRLGYSQFFTLFWNMNHYRWW